MAFLVVVADSHNILILTECNNMVLWCRTSSLFVSCDSSTVFHHVLVPHIISLCVNFLSVCWHVAEVNWVFILDFYGLCGGWWDFGFRALRGCPLLSPVGKVFVSTSRLLLITLTKRKAPVKHYSCFLAKAAEQSDSSERVSVCVREWMFSKHQAEHFFKLLIVQFQGQGMREQLFHNKTVECSSAKISLWILFSFL